MKPTPVGSERHPHGQAHATVLDDHIFVITVDRAEKQNAVTPKMAAELAAAYTRLDKDPELFVGVLTFAGGHTTASLEMPLFLRSRRRTSRTGGDRRDPIDEQCGDGHREFPGRHCVVPRTAPRCIQRTLT